MRNFFEPWPELGLPEPSSKYQNIAKTPMELTELGYDKAFDSLFDRLYFDGAGSGGWPVITEMAFKTARSDRLVWGTDYPYETHEARDFKNYINSLDRIGITEEEKP
jgi:predicted TIM-barrel fold metal-dependent hydrolase